ncbi:MULTISPECIES: hypothetical protein [Burkholderia]|uniref:hypothetical protein n=1 Tax=Burkholderia TaxID=32008 RepID=UPI00279630BE|nr:MULTISPECIES: hypothetical protein [Burkholderia]
MMSRTLAAALRTTHRHAPSIANSGRPARPCSPTSCPCSVFGVLLSVALLGEPLSPSMLAGGALVIAGVALTNRAKR